jgi:hypothetical protein
VKKVSEFLRGSLDMRGSNPDNAVFTTYFGEARGTTRRKGVKRQMARPEDVDSKQHELEVRPEHIIKIFTGDRDVTEVTPRQVARIKKST